MAAEDDQLELSKEQELLSAGGRSQGVGGTQSWREEEEKGGKKTGRRKRQRERDRVRGRRRGEREGARSAVWICV